MLIPHTRDNAAREVFAAEQRIKIHGRVRHPHGLQNAADTVLNVREQVRLCVRCAVVIEGVILFKPLQVQHRGKGVFQFGQGEHKALQGLVQALGGMDACGKTLFVEVRLVGDGQNGVGTVAFIPAEIAPPLILNELCHPVGKRTFLRRWVGPV